MTQTAATPQQAQVLTELLDRWDAELRRLMALPEPSRETATRLNQSRRILENYRRVLKGDLAEGIEKVPAAELFRAISTAEASLKQLSELGATLGPVTRD